MAFDAALAVQAPPLGAAVSAKPASRQGDASSPFGDLLAMLDNAQAGDAAPATQTATDAPTEVAPPRGKDSAKDEAADDSEASPDVAVSDPATLVAAMMAPAAVAPPPAPPADGATSPAAPAAPVSAPAPALLAAGDDLAPPPAADNSADDAAAADRPVQIAAAAPPVGAALRAAPPAAATIPAAQTAATMTLPAEPSTAEPVQAAAASPANEKPADPPRGGVSAPATDISAASGGAAPGGQDQAMDGEGDRPPSDSEAAQQAELNRSATPASETTLAAAALAAPEAPAPAVGVAQAAAPAPVIAAQTAASAVRGMPETVAHLAAQMIQRLDGRTTRFDLTLNPQSLGRVDVRIEIGAKGGLRARMAFDDAATAHEISGRQTELRAALLSAGFDVPEGALSFDVASGGGGAFADRGEADRAAAPVFQNFADTADQDLSATVKNYFSAAGSSGVDIRV